MPWNWHSRALARRDRPAATPDFRSSSGKNPPSRGARKVNKAASGWANRTTPLFFAPIPSPPLQLPLPLTHKIKPGAISKTRLHPASPPAAPLLPLAGPSLTLFSLGLSLFLLSAPLDIASLLRVVANLLRVVATLLRRFGTHAVAVAAAGSWRRVTLAPSPLLQPSSRPAAV